MTRSLSSHRRIVRNARNQVRHRNKLGMAVLMLSLFAFAPESRSSAQEVGKTPGAYEQSAQTTQEQNSTVSTYLDGNTRKYLEKPDNLVRLDAFVAHRERFPDLPIVASLLAAEAASQRFEKALRDSQSLDSVFTTEIDDQFYADIIGSVELSLGTGELPIGGKWKVEGKLDVAELAAAAIRWGAERNNEIRERANGSEVRNRQRLDAKAQIASYLDSMNPTEIISKAVAGAKESPDLTNAINSMLDPSIDAIDSSEKEIFARNPESYFRSEMRNGLAGLDANLDEIGAQCTEAQEAMNASKKELAILSLRIKHLAEGEEHSRKQTLDRITSLKNQIEQQSKQRDQKLEEFGSILTGAVEQIPTIIHNEVKNSIEEAFAAEARTKQEAQQKKIDFEARNSIIKSVDFVSAIVFGDNPIARERMEQLTAAATISNEIHMAFSLFKESIGEDGVVDFASQAALAGDLTGAASIAMKVLMKQGPSSDQIIMEQLKEIHGLLTTVRKEMHERFDKLERNNQARAREVRSNFNHAFNMIFSLTMKVDSLRQDVEIVSRQVGKLQKTVDELYPRISSDINALFLDNASLQYKLILNRTQSARHEPGDGYLAMDHFDHAVTTAAHFAGESSRNKLMRKELTYDDWSHAVNSRVSNHSLAIDKLEALYLLKANQVLTEEQRWADKDLLAYPNVDFWLSWTRLHQFVLRNNMPRSSHLNIKPLEALRETGQSVFEVKAGLWFDRDGHPTTAKIDQLLDEYAKAVTAVETSLSEAFTTARDRRVVIEGVDPKFELVAKHLPAEGATRILDPINISETIFKAVPESIRKYQALMNLESWEIDRVAGHVMHLHGYHLSERKLVEHEWIYYPQARYEEVVNYDSQGKAISVKGTYTNLFIDRKLRDSRDGLEQWQIAAIDVEPAKAPWYTVGTRVPVATIIGQGTEFFAMGEIQIGQPLPFYETNVPAAVHPPLMPQVNLGPPPSPMTKVVEVDEPSPLNTARTGATYKVKKILPYVVEHQRIAIGGNLPSFFDIRDQDRRSFEDVAASLIGTMHTYPVVPLEPPPSAWMAMQYGVDVHNTKDNSAEILKALKDQVLAHLGIAVSNRNLALERYFDANKLEELKLNLDHLTAMSLILEGVASAGYPSLSIFDNSEVAQPKIKDLLLATSHESIIDAVQAYDGQRLAILHDSVSKCRVFFKSICDVIAVGELGPADLFPEISQVIEEGEVLLQELDLRHWEVIARD